MLLQVLRVMDRDEIFSMFSMTSNALQVLRGNDRDKIISNVLTDL